MTSWSSVSDATERPDSSADVPSPDVAAFIRFCHHRRGASWPELYDEMCGVAARREFNSWDHAELAARGLAFSLQEMPRLAAWCRVVLAGERNERPEPKAQRGAGTPRLGQAAVA
jgi:hypothetical protein